MLGDAAPHRGHRLDGLAGQRLAGGDRRRGGRLRRRSLLLGGRRRRRSGAAAAGASACAGSGAAGGCRCCGCCCAPPDSTKARMSFFVTRPPEPVPGTWDGSTPCSDAIRATTGETNALPLPDGAARRRAEPRTARAQSAAGVSAGDAASASAAASAVAGSAGAASGSGALARQEPRRRAAADLPELRPDVDRLALLDEDLRHASRTPGSAPRCRPCRSRSRAAARRPRPARPPASASA